MIRGVTTSKVTVFIFFLLSIFLATVHSINVHAACGSGAYIYSTGDLGFKSFIESDPNGCDVVDLIHIDNILATDFSGYDLIIIGSDTGSFDIWGNAASVSRIEESGKPILGLGEGGYAFFGKLNLEIGFPHGWQWSAGANENKYAIFIADQSHTIFTSPYMPLQTLKVDQENYVSTFTSFGCGFPKMGNLFQSFTPSFRSLAEVDLKFRTGGSFPGTYTTTIRIRSGTVDGPVLAEIPVTFNAAPLTILDVHFPILPPVLLTPGGTYIIEWITPEEGGVYLTWMGAEYDSYAGGNAFYCAGSPSTQDDYIFKTITNILSLYSFTGEVGIYLLSPSSDIELLGGEPDDPTHYPFVQEKGRYLLWGFTGAPSSMTDEGRHLFINTIYYLTNLTPSIPTLSSPTNGEPGVSINPTFRWNASAGADSYHLQVSTDPNFGSTVVDQSGIVDTSYVVSSPLLIETYYYWRVNATNANGTSGWSEVWQFRTAPAYGNPFESLKGMFDADVDNDGIDDAVEATLGTTVGKKTLFVRPKLETAEPGTTAGTCQDGAYLSWSQQFLALFGEDPQHPGFALIPAFNKAGIEVVVIGPTYSGTPHSYSKFDDWTYDPTKDTTQNLSCDILDIVYKASSAYVSGSGSHQGHTFFSTLTPVWSWDTKGLTSSTATSSQYMSFGYYIPLAYPYPLDKYFREGAYTPPWVVGSSSPVTKTCDDNSCGTQLTPSHLSPLNLSGTAPPYGPPDGTVEFNPITFESGTGKVTNWDGTKGKEYDQNAVLRSTLVHEMGHALLSASDSDHCADSTCIMYSSTPNWDPRNFSCSVHGPGGSKDISAKIHNTLSQAHKPLAPVLSTPGCGATSPASSGTTPTLTWNASGAAASYTVQVCTTNLCTSFKVNQPGVTGTSYTVPAAKLSSKTTYWWRVRGINSAGAAGAWSFLWKFATP